MIFTRKDILFTVIAFVLFLFTSCCTPESGSQLTYSIPPQPELASGYTEKPGWATTEFSVAAANPLATDAGYQIIKSGGSAVDAAIAVQMVLTLVEPQSSGIGGGAFLMNWDGSNLQTYNGREWAPAAADENHFLDKNGEPLPFSDAVRSGLSVGVPGIIAMLTAAHEEHGKLAWAKLFKPAITLAEEGFNVSPRLHGLLESEETFRDDEIAKNFYYDENGNPREIGTLLQNPALAEVFRNIAQSGIEGFYNETVAGDIVNRIKSHERPGNMEVEDILSYPDQSFEVDPICTIWRTYEICGFPPPASGHIAIMQILGMMEYLEMPEHSLTDTIPTAEWLHQYSEAAKLAYADRALYIGDANLVEPPEGSWESLMDPEYLEERAVLIGDESMGEAEAGAPGDHLSLFGTQPVQPEMGTSHISIVDREGNTVSMTTTIESGFGSRIMSDGGTGLAGGFILNNELTDFSLEPVDEQGRPIANRVEPNKRPRSSMSPTIVFERESGDLVVSVGSPGGSSIIHYTAKALVGMLDWGLNAQEAINLPNFANYNGPTILESDRFPNKVIDGLERMGHRVIIRDLTSGLQAIQKTEDGYFGGADPRREGVVMGD